MALFTPASQLRDMQQHYAAQQLLGGTRRPDQDGALMKKRRCKHPVRFLCNRYR